MGTLNTYNKSGVDIQCDSPLYPAPRPQTEFPIPNIQQPGLISSLVSLNLVSLTGQAIQAVSVTAAGLPVNGDGTMATWTLFYQVYQGSPTTMPQPTPVVMNVVNGDFSYTINAPTAGSTVNVWLESTDGSQVTTYPFATITTPADPTQTPTALAVSDQITIVNYWNQAAILQYGGTGNSVGSPGVGSLDYDANALSVSHAAYDAAITAYSSGLIAAGAPTNWAVTWGLATSTPIYFGASNIMASIATWQSAIQVAQVALQQALAVAAASSITPVAIGDGMTTQFLYPGSGVVKVNGVVETLGTNYTYSAGILTFLAAPAVAALITGVTSAAQVGVNAINNPYVLAPIDQMNIFNWYNNEVAIYDELLTYVQAMNLTILTNPMSAYTTAMGTLTTYLGTISSTWSVTFGNPTGPLGGSLATISTDEAAVVSQRTALQVVINTLTTGNTSGSMVPPLQMWAMNGSSNATTIDSSSPQGTQCLVMSAPAAFPDAGVYVPIDPTRQYKTHFWAKSNGANGLLYFCLQQFLDQGFTTCANSSGRSPFCSGSGVTPPSTWTMYEYVWQGGAFQAGVKYVKPEFLGNYNGSTGNIEIAGFQMFDVTEANNAQNTANTSVVWTAGGTAPNYTLTPAAGFIANTIYYVLFPAGTDAVAATMNVSGSGAERIYQITPLGVRNPTILPGQTLALQQQGGSWVITDPTAVATCLPGATGLTMYTNGTSDTVSITATSLSMISAQGTGFGWNNAQAYSARTSISGAGGLDTGTTAANTIYYVYIIAQAAGGGSTPTAILSLSSTGPTLPAGYYYWVRVGAIRTGGSYIPWPMFQSNHRVQLMPAAGSSLTALPVLCSGAVGSWSVSAPTWGTVYLGSSIPSTATRVSICVQNAYNNGFSNEIDVAPNSNYAGTDSTNPPPISLGQSVTNAIVADLLLQSPYIYACTNGVSPAVLLVGWEDNF